MNLKAISILIPFIILVSSCDDPFAEECYTCSYQYRDSEPCNALDCDTPSVNSNNGWLGWQNESFLIPKDRAQNSCTNRKKEGIIHSINTGVHGASQHRQYRNVNLDSKKVNCVWSSGKYVHN